MCVGARGHGHVVEELLKNGADPDVKDQLQHTPFMMATWFGKVDCARKLFDKVCVCVELLELGWHVGSAAVCVHVRVHDL